MKENEDKLQQVNGVAPTEEAPVEERPNRAEYAKMLAEDYPDLDFEDKEARYGKMVEDRKRYKDLYNSSSQLTKQLDKNRWLGAMFKDLAENPEKNPLVWLVDNGIDVRGALEDPEIMAQVDEAFSNFKKVQAEAEEAEKKQDEELGKSLDALAAVQKEVGLSDEQADRMWEHFWENIFQPAFEGKVTKDTWKAILRAQNYDKDIANAREESAMMARNEKHQNKVKSFEEKQVPPSFSQGGSQPVSPKKERRESLMDFVKRNS